MRLLVALSLCVAVLGEFVKMGRMNSRSSFVRNSKTSPETSHELIFAVQQRNLEKLDGILLERSTPGSSKYQQWLSFEEVGDLTSNPSGANTVKEWLTSNGIAVTWESVHHDYIKATSTVQLWEQLLDTSFYNWQDTALKGTDVESQLFVRSSEYSIPSALQGHVSAVFNTVQVPPVIHKDYHLRPNNKVMKTNLRLRDILEHNPSLLTEEQAPDVTVAFLNTYYDIPSNIGTNALNQSVFETSHEYFSQADLLQFQQSNSLTQQAAIDIGGDETSDCNVIDSCTEGNLDIQFIMGVSQVTSSIYWYVPGNDAFVNWVTDMADESNPPKTNSMSWGAIEQDQSAETLNAFTTEAQKATLMGVTIMVSSGDDGVSNYDCSCNTNSGSSTSSWTGSNTWSGRGYFPSFPATCPYVTAVGATMFPLNVNGNKNDKPEIACQSQYGGIITSGGGFSTYYAQPSWQTNAVNSYFNSITIQPASGYNIQGRAYPDVAVLGVNYQVVIHGEVVPVYGTSCASPMFAGLISLINARRYSSGLSTVGWINPTIWGAAVEFDNGNYYNLYFNDVTEGGNSCCSNSDYPSPTTCCQAGFNATKGWDPVTGWGSVQYGNLSLLFPSTSSFPTLNPSIRPTPLPGYPTYAPTVSNVVSTTITQQVLGSGLNEQSFYDSLANINTFVESVEASIANTANVVINYVTDVYSSNAHKQAESTVTGISVDYTVSVNNGADVSSQTAYNNINAEINSAVSSNNFTMYLQSYAAINNATVLKDATSNSVTVSDSFSAPTFAPTNSPGNSSNSTAIIVGVVVPLLVILICAGAYWWFYGKPTSGGSASNLDVPIAVTVTAPATIVVNPITRPGGNAAAVHNNIVRASN